MSEPARKTDFTPRKVFDRRADQSLYRRDKYLTSTGILMVPYSNNFDEFAGQVAFALRHKIVYRTDGGKFARGLVRASNELKIIHDLYRTAVPPPERGTPIRLKAYFWRRQDPVAANRWVMLVRFQSPDWIFNDDDNEVMVPDPRRMDDLRKRQMENTLACADVLARQFQGRTGIHITKMVDLAERVGYPANNNLWYYDHRPAFDYFTWRTDDKTRKEMTQATSGKLPFDGSATYRFGAWRVYPFRILATNFGSLDAGTCDANMKRQLAITENLIAQETFQKMEGELSHAHMGGGKIYSPLAKAFYEHLESLQKDRNHLYSAFN